MKAAPIYHRALDLEAKAAALAPYWLAAGWWQIRLPCGCLVCSPKNFHKLVTALKGLASNYPYTLTRIGTAAQCWRVRYRLEITISAGGRRTVRRLARVQHKGS